MKNIFQHLRFLNEQRKFFREKAEQGEPLCVMDDKVFKLMLASDSEDSREALRCLLSACTRREVSEVKVVNSELLPLHLEGKSPRLDVNVTFNDGELADLEMQIKRTEDDLKERSSQYLSMLHAGQIRKGREYSDTKRVYQIFFLNFELFPGSDKVPRRYGFREEIEHDLLTDKTEIIFYEMPKLEQKVKAYFENKSGIETLSEEEKWCIYFRYRHEQKVKPLISELCRKEEGIMKAEKEVLKVSHSFKRYIRQMSKMKDEIDLRYKLRNARKEEATNIARNLLAKGSTPEFVSEITGLSLEDISKL